MIRPTFCTIDLAAAARNYRAIRASLKEGTKMMAVVKADAYGHGSVPISRVALANGADGLAVAIPEEGGVLREAGITAPIVVIGGIVPEDAPLVVQHGLTQTVYTKELVQALEAACASQEREAEVHLKIDSGMGRIGVRTNEELDEVLRALSSAKHLRLTGVFTHFANADGADKAYAHEQAERFQALLKRVRERGFDPQVHMANSGAILDLPEMECDMVRPGIIQYGYYPSQLVGRTVPVEPVMTWKSQVTYVKSVPAGETISYDRTYPTWRTTSIATLPVGYGDGYKRALSGRGCVLLHGQRAPILGRVCMDQIMVDVTEIPGVQIGDEAVLLGRQGEESIDADEMAAWADTISYEILLSVSGRVPRVYLHE